VPIALKNIGVEVPPYNFITPYNFTPYNYCTCRINCLNLYICENAQVMLYYV